MTKVVQPTQSSLGRYEVQSSASTPGFDRFGLGIAELPPCLGLMR